MIQHEPEGYDCPFCRIVDGRFGDGVVSLPQDIFYKDEIVSAFVSAVSRPHNTGNVLIIPNAHYENIGTMPPNVLAYLHIISQSIMEAMVQSYEDCDSVSFRQHNGPNGDQCIWHYHLHIIPRYPGDQFYSLHTSHYRNTPESRLVFAQTLRSYFEQHPIAPFTVRIES